MAEEQLAVEVDGRRRLRALQLLKAGSECVWRKVKNLAVSAVLYEFVAILKEAGIFTVFENID